MALVLTRKKKLVITFLLLATFVLIACIKLNLSKYFSPFSHTTISFDTYWAACKTLEAGSSPYDQAALSKTMQLNAMSWNAALNYYNPPWFLPLICKFAILSPDYALLSYQITCLIVILTAIFFIGLKVYKSIDALNLLLFCNVINLPFWVAISDGQSAVLMAVASTCFVGFYLANCWLMAGICFALLSIKPHLSLLFAFFILMLSAKTNRRAFLFYAFVSFALLVCSSFMVGPGLMNDWVAVMLGKSDLAAKPHWLGTNLAAWLMALQYTHNGGVSNELTAYIVSAASIVIVLYIIFREKQINRSAIGMALIFSSFAAPYGYIYDQHGGALALFLVITSLAAKRIKLFMTLAWIAINTFLYFCLRGYMQFYHELTWYPAVLVAFLLTMQVYASRLKLNTLDTRK